MENLKQKVESDLLKWINTLDDPQLIRWWGHFQWKFQFLNEEMKKRNLLE